MLRVGLTGGIGAGKSTVSKVLANLGAVIVDADLIAREVVEPGTPGLAALVDAFGDDILHADGSLNRPALAEKAFGSDESRLLLNSILHPRIGQRTAELVEGASADGIVVQDIPLLVEGRMGPAFNLVVVVYVDVEERVRRLVELRGMPEVDARARIAAQATDEQRRATADVWLDNSGAPELIEAQVRALYTDRLVPFEANLRSRTVVGVPPVLRPADPGWAGQGHRLVERLRAVCGGGAVRIDHVGSTAVPGLDARDLIDIQITVSDLAAAAELTEPLAAAGFPPIPAATHDEPKPVYGVGGEADPALWDKRTHGGADPGRPVEISVRVDGWPGQRFALLLRDWLRADEHARDEFLEVKRTAAEKAALEDGDATVIYSRAMAPWFDRGYQRAWEWAESTGWAAGD
ncbi:dephospho-CoA kinase [Rhodococcus sp. SGAir0479]|uniref:dephospho-CoA kinase n=1 Tax=Rhodococcus sp. SGAir0479 TaxID=2567884 RepID=UPI001C2FF0FC|nr:dephospho-CoA kinase [Rhodococcus sp. SGAir0479]